MNIIFISRIIRLIIIPIIKLSTHSYSIAFTQPESGSGFWARFPLPSAFRILITGTNPTLYPRNKFCLLSRWSNSCKITASTLSIYFCIFPCKSCVNKLIGAWCIDKYFWLAKCKLFFSRISSNPISRENCIIVLTSYSGRYLASCFSTIFVLNCIFNWFNSLLAIRKIFVFWCTNIYVVRSFIPWEYIWTSCILNARNLKIIIIRIRVVFGWIDCCGFTLT